jgi:hypothetical protein
MRSLALVGDQVADRAPGGDATSSSSAFRDSGCGDEAFGDESIERAWPIEGHESGDRLAVVCDGHLVSGAYGIEVPAQVVAQFADASFHPPSMAPFLKVI